MSATFNTGDEVTLTLAEESIPAVVVTDDGSASVIVRFAHPTLEKETTAVPVLREFLTHAGSAS